MNRLLTLFGFWMFTIYMVSGQTMPDKLRTVPPLAARCELITASTTHTTTPPTLQHHQYSTHASSHHATDQAIEQVEEISVKKEDAAPQADRFAQQGFHPRWCYDELAQSITCLPSYTRHIANQLAIRTERYILFQDFRI